VSGALHDPLVGERRLVVMSDIEMGAGGPTDDFAHDAWFAALLRERVGVDERPVDLVFNGDTLDFLKTSVDGGWPRHIDADVALARLDRIAAAHPLYFETLRDLLASHRCDRVVFVEGNHDYELIFPEVRQAIRRLLGQGERVLFPGTAWRIGDVHIEHGHQTDVLFATDPDHRFVEIDGRKVLALPWGAVAVIDVTLPLEPVFYPFDRMRPRGRVLELLPEAKDLLLSTFWRYWTREYLPRAWRRSDPLTRLSWPMLKEIAYRFGTASTGVSSGAHWQQALKDNDDVRLVVLGHEHRTEWWTWSDRKLLRDGCIRDEYHLGRDGVIGRRLPKVWAEARLRDGHVVESALVEREAPQDRREAMPERVQDLLPAMRELLAREPESGDDRRQRQAQDAADDAPLPELEDGAQADAVRHPARSLQQALRDALLAGRSRRDAEGD